MFDTVRVSIVLLNYGCSYVCIKCDVKCIFYHLLKNQNTESFAHHNYFAFCLFCLEDLLHIILFFVSSTNSNSLFKTQLL